MIIYPAIDLKEGRVVRLRQGDPTQKTIYSDNPVEVAQRWLDAGANWVHIVNLDGALDAGANTWAILEAIGGLNLSIQFGGGLRTAADVQQAFNSGVQRAVLGTAAVENPALVEALIHQYGAERISVALDAKNGKVATHGWKTESDWTALALGRAMAQKGVQHALYTDISRDGALGGVNVEATRQLARETGLQVIASGGVRSIEDVKALAGTEVAGVILGKALYENLIDLAEAIRLADL
ncbi:MAG: 1-(5-phosphoribosyl)-5-[(5-phosphoribosylamino)methylideneamino]imidazole-4-carboxamide isomerase [Anaerolineae bacterium]|nr:MAG: 1-(5-phosphoribosyl)-5-[(5-phosphoribosylamino)methylideneamino]imidazole-4-carboxamide isomerase [Anaerolineae bacterium]